MAFVITQNCCTDASCVPVCPVDCIRPVPAADGAAATMLYIDPKTCVDCGACVEVCPVDAIRHEDELPDTQVRFKEINASYFTGNPLAIRPMPPRRPADATPRGPLRVAVVGAGPAACYAVSDLAQSGAEVSVFERLPTPFGLVRFGVAPDHQRTKDVVSTFEESLGRSDVSCYFNVEVGRDITHDELMAHHHAVVYAVGAAHSRTLGIPGAELVGNHAAGELVGWYNGHPDNTALRFELSGTRAVIVGNGNVALDVARMLVMDRDELAATDVAEHALKALRHSSIQEVVVLGRRGAADAAFSIGELLALGNLRDVDVVVRGERGARPNDFDGALKFDVVAEFAARAVTPGNRRIVLWFGARPVEAVGLHAVEALVIDEGAATTTIETSMVLRAIGYRGSPIPGLPFDDKAGVVPNEQGRVLTDGAKTPGVYVTGWIKRGPRGVIGTNRMCAGETVKALLDDARTGVLSNAEQPKSTAAELLGARGVTIVDWAGWRAIDAEERHRGSTAARPRIKMVDRDALLDVAAR